MIRTILLVVFLLSIGFNFYLIEKNQDQEAQLSEHQKLRLVVNDNGDYYIDSVSKIFQSIKPVDRQALDCLAVNIYREAATESMAGKIAVGQVVINRTKTKQYPKDICKVIYQKTTKDGSVICQFSWVCAKKLPIIEKNSQAWKKSLKAAHTILSYDSKIVPDITNGATHYHTHMVDPQWKNALKLAAVIDQHKFYRIQ